MAHDGHKKALVVIQLNGGNDALNTVIPLTDGYYNDFRPKVRIEPDQVLKIDNRLGFNPNMAPIKKLWDEGKVAVINGIGYPNPNRSHFRSMDIWHTCEPVKVSTEGWLGRAIREMDPTGENVLTGVNFGRGLPRALVAKGVQVASVGNLSTYGLYPDVEDEFMRRYALDVFSRMYGGGEGRDAVIEALGKTGSSVLRGADLLRTAPAKYQSNVEYAANPIAQSMQSVAQVLLADLGTRVFYTQHASFDTHAGELETHSRLWREVSGAVADFMDDLKGHGREDDVVVLIFSEFGRRIKDNGSGTDHGCGGVAFVIGSKVKGGLYGEYPSLAPEKQLDGDLRFNNDFRGTYSTILEQWLGIEAAPVVEGHFEQFQFVK